MIYKILDTERQNDMTSGRMALITSNKNSKKQMDFHKNKQAIGK